MTAHPRHCIRGRHGTPDDPLGGREASLLLVVESAQTLDELAQWDGGDGTMVIAYADFTVEKLTRINPDFVVARLVSYSFDCTDVARKLVDGGFKGKMRVLCTPLPKPELVSDELRATFPSLEIELWLVPPS